MRRRRRVWYPVEEESVEEGRISAEEESVVSGET